VIQTIHRTLRDGIDYGFRIPLGPLLLPETIRVLAQQAVDGLPYVLPSTQSTAKHPLTCGPGERK
jgi:hypothetical protein